MLIIIVRLLSLLGGMSAFLISGNFFIRGIRIQDTWGGTGEIKDAAISGLIFSALALFGVLIVGKMPRFAAFCFLFACLGMYGSMGPLTSIPVLLLFIAAVFSFFIRKKK